MANLDKRKQNKRRVVAVRNALAATVKKLRREIETIQARGNFPADYSLGFANGLIFCEAQLNNQEPRFYDRTSSIGKLVKPMALLADGEDPRAQELDALYAVAVAVKGMQTPLSLELEKALNDLWKTLEIEGAQGLRDYRREHFLALYADDAIEQPEVEEHA